MLRTAASGVPSTRPLPQPSNDVAAHKKTIPSAHLSNVRGPGRVPVDTP
jgi:hypothetical protein